MRIEIDYGKICSIEKKIGDQIGQSGIKGQISALETQMKSVENSWSDKTNKQHIKALEKRIVDLRKMSEAMTGYQKVLSYIGDSYKETVQNNMNIVKNL